MPGSVCLLPYPQLILPCRWPFAYPILPTPPTGPWCHVFGDHLSPFRPPGKVPFPVEPSFNNKCSLCVLRTNGPVSYPKIFGNDGVTPARPSIPSSLLGLTYYYPTICVARLITRNRTFFSHSALLTNVTSRRTSKHSLECERFVAHAHTHAHTHRRSGASVHISSLSRATLPHTYTPLSPTARPAHPYACTLCGLAYCR